MRLPRWKAPPEHPAGYYHCVSRVVDRRFAFDVPEREKFRQFLSEYTAFCGVRVLTWCILSNHFHLLLEVPRKPDVPPPLEELIPRLGSLSSSSLSVKAAQALLDQWKASDDTTSVEDLRQRLWAQMYDLSAFMKLLKQRFTQWFNGMHDRKGTLWEERFSSNLLEGTTMDQVICSDDRSDGPRWTRSIVCTTSCVECVQWTRSFVESSDRRPAVASIRLPPFENIRSS